MPRRRKKRLLRPRTPARVKKTKRAKKARGHQHPELVGLVLAALGIFLSTVVYLGWSGGPVGNWLENGVEAVVGGGVYAVPVALVVVGSLMLARSDLVDVGPFRMGVAVSTFSLLLALGPHGGFGGRALNGVFGTLLGDTGAAIAGGTGLVAGALLLSGASAGALLRRSGTAVRRTAGAARRSLDRGLLEPVEEPAPLIPFPDQDTHESPEQASLFDATAVSKDYELPDRGVLRHSEKRGDGGADTSGHIAQVLMQALADFGVEASVIGQIVGPRVTRYELQLAPGTKMSKVSALKDDLSYALATTEIRILAPIPGKQAVGVEVPNLTPNLVTLGDIYDDLPQTASPLAVWLGKDISGNAVWTDLARMPHILIAGTTGSGKSGCINTILTSILLRSTPDEVRMILIDPKRIELNYYESIPHLLAPVVSSPKEATAVLANVIGEMERRYERLSQVRARSLPEANRAFRERGEQQLPYLLVVIDELADLMMISPQAVEDAVIRLAQKSRAVGIHLVL